MSLDSELTRSDVGLLREIGTASGQSAEAELCRRYQRRVYLYGLRHLGDVDSAWDLTQDVLGLLLEKSRRGEVRDPSRLSSFVMGSCRLLTVNRTRAEKRRRCLLARYLDPEFGLEEHPADRHDLEWATRCLAALSDRERAVLHLSFWADLEASAIAAELGTTAGHVRVLRHRALTRLQGQILEAGG